MGINEKFLLDDFHRTGTDEREFKWLLDDISLSTSVKRYPLTSLELFSVLPKAEQTKPDSILCYRFCPKNPLNIGGGKLRAVAIRKEEFLKIADFNSVIDETIEGSGILIYNAERNTIYFTSNGALNTLLQQLGAMGDAMNLRTPERDAFAACLMNRYEETSMIIKQYRRVGKVFAFMGSNYQKADITEITKMAERIRQDDELGKLECIRWDVTHKMASISYNLPDLREKTVARIPGITDDVMPVLNIRSSDTAYTAFTTSMEYDIGGHRIPGPSASVQHRSLLDFEKVYQNVYDTVIQGVMDVPDRLQELSEVRITPENIESEEKSCGVNLKVILAAMRALFAVSGISSVIGKKTQTKILEEMVGVIDPTRSYTAYDLLKLFSAIPDMEENQKPLFWEDGRKKLKKCVAEALYADYKKIAKQAAAE